MNDALPAPFDVRLMNLTASLVFLGCAALLAAAGGWWALRHPAFAVGAIVVDGKLVHNNAVTLRANLAGKLAGNIFTVNLAATRAVFEAVPWVRRATVRREFPNQLHVTLEEHVPVAFWGDEDSSTMLDTYGAIFEANTGEVDALDLPRLSGPAGDSAEVLAMQHALAPVLEPLGVALEDLALTGSGSWRASLDSGAVLELGGGSLSEVLARSQRFARTVAQVTQTYSRHPDDLESADLRYGDGYAVRMRGVTTITAEAADIIARQQEKKAKARPATGAGAGATPKAGAPHSAPPAAKKKTNP